VRTADLTTFMCRLSRNLVASASWKTEGLGGPELGLIALPFDTTHSSINTLYATRIYTQNLAPKIAVLRVRVEIQNGRPAILTNVFHGFPQPLQPNTMLSSPIKARPLPLITSPNHYFIFYLHEHRN
jgi:hypothetical protein